MSIHAYNLFSSNPPPFPLLQLLFCPPPATFPSIFMCTLSLIPLSPFSVPVCAHAWDHLLSGTTSVMKTDSPLQYPLLQALLHPCWGFGWLEFIYEVPASVSSCVQLPCHVLQILFPVAPAIFLLPIPWWFLSFGRKGCSTDVQFRA